MANDTQAREPAPVETWFTPIRSFPSAAPQLGRSDPADVARWLIGPGRALTEPAALLDELSWRLVAAGVPLARTTFHIGTLHPQFLGLMCRWQRRLGHTDEAAIAHGVRDTAAYQRSPLRRVIEDGDVVRRRLDVPEDRLEYPVLKELKAEGLTDYLATPLLYSSGRIAAATWSTDRADGFTDADITRITDLLPVLSLLVEVQAVRRMAANLLNVYLGRKTGQRVLSGEIMRGSGETIRAVLLFADLRGFTQMSEQLPAQSLIGLLNAYFERVVAAIQARDGEVLKFIGDGLLAIFPVEDAAFAFNAARRALEAAEDAFADLAAYNTDPCRPGETTLRMAIALHSGDVVYGNIGGQDRLDFTAIGPAVNLVSRLQQLSKRLDCALLISDDFAKVCERPMRSLGFHPVRGLSDPHEVFTLRDWQDPCSAA